VWHCPGCTTTLLVFHVTNRGVRDWLLVKPKVADSMLRVSTVHSTQQLRYLPRHGLRQGHNELLQLRPEAEHCPAVARRSTCSRSLPHRPTGGATHAHLPWSVGPVMAQPWSRCTYWRRSRHLREAISDRPEPVPTLTCVSLGSVLVVWDGQGGRPFGCTYRYRPGVQDATGPSARWRTRSWVGWPR
jgi:hypothetical protein